MMARNPDVAGGRPHVLTLRVTTEELARIERARGGLSRSAFIRLVLLDAIKGS